MQECMSAELKTLVEKIPFGDNYKYTVSGGSKALCPSSKSQTENANYFELNIGFRHIKTK